MAAGYNHPAIIVSVSNENDLPAAIARTKIIVPGQTTRESRRKGVKSTERDYEERDEHCEK